MSKQGERSGHHWGTPLHDQLYAESIERKRKALELRRKGLTYREIGELIGTSLHNARRLCIIGERRGM